MKTTPRMQEIIQQSGIPTFPRPQGIPENFLVQITKKGVGMKYVHPTNTKTSVRIMPGKPHSSNLHQKKPYVVQVKDGMYLDKDGNIVNSEAPTAHLPINEFVFKE